METQTVPQSDKPVTQIFVTADRGSKRLELREKKKSGPR
jgi:hypothetical protein